MNRTEKQQLVDELTTKIKGAKALYYTDFTGLNVKRMTELRRRLKKAGVEYVVIKNTLALRAVNESGLVGQKLKGDRKSTRLNSSHVEISYAVFCLKKKIKYKNNTA